MKLFEKTRIPTLHTALSAYALRNKVISSNIANINTIGYKAKSVTFEDELSGAMQESRVVGAQTDRRHMAIGRGGPSENTARVVNGVPEGSQANDPLASGVNNVEIDHEMAELAKNQIRFKFSAKLIGETFRGIQKSIRGQA